MNFTYVDSFTPWKYTDEVTAFFFHLLHLLALAHLHKSKICVLLFTLRCTILRWSRLPALIMTTRAFSFNKHQVTRPEFFLIDTLKSNTSHPCRFAFDHVFITEMPASLHRTVCIASFGICDILTTDAILLSLFLFLKMLPALHNECHLANLQPTTTLYVRA